MIRPDHHQLLDTVFNHLQDSQDPAMMIAGKAWTYPELKERVLAIESHWIKNKEGGILIVAHDHIDTYAAILACWSLGKFYVPIHPTYPEERVEQIKTIIKTEYVFDPIQNSVPARIAETDWTLTRAFPDEKSWAYVLFTSGSTGEPKGVPIGWSNLSSFMKGFRDLGYELNKRDRFLQMFDLTFDLSVMSFLVPLSLGASFYTVPYNSLKYAVIAELLEDHQLSFALMVPSILTYLSPYFDEINAKHLRYSLFCGEALHEDIVHQWAQCVPHAQIDNVYGPTENTIFCTRYTFDSSQPLTHQGILSIGSEMTNVACAIWNDHQQVLPEDEVGNLWLSGHYLTSGYLNRPDLNQSQFVMKDNVRWYNSGDLAARNKEGQLLYMGRQDSQLKIQGFRIEAAEVEFQLKKLIPEGSRVVALGIPNALGLMELVAVVENEEWDPMAIKEALAKVLPPYMIPSKLINMPSFPLNSNGKVDRKKITEWVKY